MKDYYETLGVGRDATQDEVKKAFRQLALKYHPDRNPDNKISEDKFKEINEAYSCLGDAEKRRQYDMTGFCGTEAFGGFGPGAGFGAGKEAFGGFGDVFEDIFGEFFGAAFGRRGPRPERGQDLRYDVQIDLTEAAQGKKLSIKIPRSVNCAECNGTGSATGQTAVCPDCKGTGQVRFQQGFFSVSRTCGRCRGAGRVIEKPCGKCHGSGRVQVERDLTINIPAGVEDAMRFRVSGEGNTGSYGGPPGDLYVIVGIKPHPGFRRDGDDIICEQPVSFAQAALGVDLEIDTLWGSEKLHVPAGTQPGETFRLKGKGMPRMGKKSRGDHVVKVRVVIPGKLNDKQRELLEELARLSGESFAAKSTLKDKLRGMFAAGG
ncbi:MAG: molecular chaperone DnaJ [Nitrospiraceae bacterium]|nr:molecular chaperone DnaJ [Nitrospiraceae bacterium]